MKSRMGSKRVDRLRLLVGLAAFAASCRVETVGPRWTEAHGQGWFKALAASSKGLAGLGLPVGVYAYPGDWGRPWRQVWTQSGLSIAATDEDTYVLQANGDVVRLSQAARPWARLEADADTMLFGGPPDRLYAIVKGRPQRIEPSAATALDCGVPARRLAITERAVFVVQEGGALFRADDAGCARVELSGPVDDFAVTREHHFALRHGRAYVVERGKLEPLPVPQRYRQNQGTPEALAEITASRNVLWALSSGGLAFQLAMP